MGHTVSTEEFKEPWAASLSFPLINNMVSWPSCSAMHVTTMHSAKQHHEPDFPLATLRALRFSLADGLYVFHSNRLLRLHK